MVARLHRFRSLSVAAESWRLPVPEAAPAASRSCSPSSSSSWAATAGRPFFFCGSSLGLTLDFLGLAAPAAEASLDKVLEGFFFSFFTGVGSDAGSPLLGPATCPVCEAISCGGRGERRGAKGCGGVLAGGLSTPYACMQRQFRQCRPSMLMTRTF